MLISFLKLVIAILAATLIQISPANSVQLDPGHRGQALVVPLFITRSGFATTLTIMTTEDSGYYQALKVNFRDHDGDLLKSVNIYLEREDSWVAALTASGPGQSQLEIPDESCTLTDQAGTVEELDAAVLPADYGFIEIVEMGGFDSGELTEETGSYDCPKLVQTWNDGSWNEHPNRYFSAPVGNLAATASLINVDRGTMYSMNATALENFSNIAQHTEPASDFPDLSAAHDEGTDSGATGSVVCTAGKCREDSWENPVDAVSAALSARELIGDYVLEDAVGAATEFVVTYPTRRFYEDFPANSLGLIPVSAYMVTREGVGVGSFCFMPVEYHCTTTSSLSHEGAVHSISIKLDGQGRDGEKVVSPILGLEQEPVRPYYQPEPTGRLRLGYPFSPFGVSNSGTRYAGIPVIGLVLQEFVNGTISGEDGAAIRSNYGNSFSLIRKPDIEYSGAMRNE